MFYICKSVPTTPGRFENRFWCEFAGTVGKPGKGWSTAKLYAIEFPTREAADLALRAIGDNRAYVSQVFEAM